MLLPNSRVLAKTSLIFSFSGSARMVIHVVVFRLQFRVELEFGEIWITNLIHKFHTSLPFIFMTGVQPPGPHPKSPI